MERTITGWHRGDDGDWVAELSCLHGQHVRHRPPYRVAPWVDTAEGRTAHVGTSLDCPPCDRAELPAGLSVLRTTATWDEHSTPAGLTGEHRVAAGRWGRLQVLDGALGFWLASDPSGERTVRAGEAQAIPPEVVHRVVLRGPVRFHVSFLGRHEDDEGGDPACWAGRVEDHRDG
ncbi:DUF3565 domain-containing protein [Iamia sp. SCSIO 61187]|uniref:DUF3565 domain-containing protein n=1 Tax=Iamia sp. SCSIO 61187 TaxID=2722752 RepID=UPI001C630048|nr:DUF3565 domain-containing protein [Iamia sp. SCSIO 61187]QYG93114.1 DUF3565 domain-containing protein [Iamia sp. SCSIO 61187]